MHRVRAVTANAFYSHPAWEDHPVDESGNVIVDRWVQPGEVVSVSSQSEHWRDYYGAFLVAQPVPEESPSTEPERPADPAPLEPEKPAKKAAVIKKGLKTKK